MDYRMSVKDFLDLSKNNNIDFQDFSFKLVEEVEKLNNEFHFSHSIPNFSQESNEYLFGLPFSVKENICVKNIESTAGSRILEGYKPPFDATSVHRMKDAGANFLCKTNQDEFGFGTFSTNSAFEVPLNPIDKTRVAGGSSGGSAVITKVLDFPHISLAESTGGSISCPAAFSSVVGLTPTYGLVSRYGLIDYANSLDKIGIMGKTVYDVALGLSVVAGKDEHDQTSLGEKNDYTNINTNLKGMKIGVVKEYFENIDEKIDKTIMNVIGKIEDAGAEVVEISLSNTKYALSSYYIIATAEASTNLAKFCGMRYGLHLELEGNFDSYFSSVRTNGFGTEAKRRIMLGTFTRLSGYRDAYYLKALKARTLVISDFKKAFNKVDAIVSPTMPILPPKFSEVDKLDPLDIYQMDILTVPPNLAGVPMISIPIDDMIGLHIIGDHLTEQKLLNVAAGVENIV